MKVTIKLYKLPLQLVESWFSIFSKSILDVLDVNYKTTHKTVYYLCNMITSTVIYYFYNIFNI